MMMAHVAGIAPDEQVHDPLPCRPSSLGESAIRKSTAYRRSAIVGVAGERPLSAHSSGASALGIAMKFASRRLVHPGNVRASGALA